MSTVYAVVRGALVLYVHLYVCTGAYDTILSRILF